MAARKRYQLDRVTAKAGEGRASTWTFGGKPVSGTEQSYLVMDGNFPSRNQWQFLVRLPKDRNGRIEIRPRATPNVKAWAELPDRSITFSLATRGEARGKWDCQVALADPTGARSRDVVRGDERSALPRWFDGLRGRMRVKQNVKPTKGTDGEALVVLVSAGDYLTMIRIFFATKVWILKERIALAS